MSAHSCKRKQELVERLAVTRCDVLDEAESIGHGVGDLASFPRRLIGGAIKNHSVILLGICVCSGIVAIKFVSGLFHRSGREHLTIGDVAKRSVFATVLSSVWGMFLASAMPVVKKNIQNVISDQVSKYLGGKQAGR